VKKKNSLIILNGFIIKEFFFQEKTILKYRTKTDTSRLVDYTKALGITILKELGKLHP